MGGQWDGICGKMVDDNGRRVKWVDGGMGYVEEWWKIMVKKTWKGGEWERWTLGKKTMIMGFATELRWERVLGY